MIENDLVMVRIKNSTTGYSCLEDSYVFKNYDVWVRVMFIDLDGSFIGRVERIDNRIFKTYKLGEDVKLNSRDVQNTYSEGIQFCYSDNVSICECNDLCREK